MRAKQLGHPDLFGRVVGANPLENIVYRHFAARGQGTALRRNGLALRPQRFFLFQQYVARLAIGGALVGKGQMRHHGPPFRRQFRRTASYFMSPGPCRSIAAHWSATAR